MMLKSPTMKMPSKLALRKTKRPFTKSYIFIHQGANTHLEAGEVYIYIIQIVDGILHYKGKEGIRQVATENKPGKRNVKTRQEKLKHCTLPAKENMVVHAPLIVFDLVVSVISSYACTCIAIFNWQIN